MPSYFFGPVREGGVGRVPGQGLPLPRQGSHREYDRLIIIICIKIKSMKHEDSGPHGCVTVPGE